MTVDERREYEALKTDADNCGQALRRFGTFRPEKDPSCAFCWIVQEERSSVEPTARPEVFRCAKCEAEYSLLSGPAS